MKTKILILLLTSFLFISCNEDDNPFTLPDATQIGANTAGCYIDGDLYVLKNVVENNSWLGSGKTISLSHKYDENSQLWHIYIYMKMEGNSSNKNKSISFSLKSNQKFSPKKINLMDFDYGNGNNFAMLFNDGQTKNDAGEITLTKIETNDNYNLIAGTFNFNIIHRLTKKTIKITNGRFDLKIPKK